MEEDLRGSIDIFGEILELRNYKIGSSKNPRTVDASLYWDPTLGGGSEKLRFHKGRFKTFSEKEFKSFLSKSLIFPNGRRAPATITLSDVEKPWRNDFENGPALNVFVVDPSDDPISYCNVSGPGLSHFTKKYPDPMPLRDFLDELLLLVFVRSPDSRRSTDLTFTIKGILAMTTGDHFCSEISEEELKASESFSRPKLDECLFDLLKRKGGSLKRSLRIKMGTLGKKGGSQGEDQEGSQREG